jgi:hypothetical protein
MTEHTKEPWAVAGISDEMIVAKVSELAHAHIATIHHNKNDSRRIVACVNACRGLPTEELEQISERPGAMRLVSKNLKLAVACSGGEPLTEQVLRYAFNELEGE